MTNPYRQAWLEVDLDVVTNNVRLLAKEVAPSAMWAVVKANGYGHGAVPVAHSAVSGGAAGLCVALAEEGVELRRGGVTAPILMLSEAPVEAMAIMVQQRISPSIYTESGLAAFETAAESAGVVAGVHVKVDTGMNRVGASVDLAPVLIDRILRSTSLRLEGIFTHFASADEPDDPLTQQQAQRLRGVAAATPDVPIHACNSAGALVHPTLRMSMVRMGIAIYGIAPSPEVGLPAGIRPALSLKAKVSYAKDLPVGSKTSYGQRYQLPGDARVATIPLGYADGVPRALGSSGGEALVNGRRRPIAGTVTMDQIILDCGDDDAVEAGTEVVLLGRQGAEAITAEDWATLTDTIGYEVVCRFGQRLERRYLAQGSTVDLGEATELATEAINAEE